MRLFTSEDISHSLLAASQVKDIQTLKTWEKKAFTKELRGSCIDKDIETKLKHTIHSRYLAEKKNIEMLLSLKLVKQLILESFHLHLLLPRFGEQKTHYLVIKMTNNLHEKRNKNRWRAKD